jgi:phage terminase large subunit-like protein
MFDSAIHVPTLDELAYAEQLLHDKRRANWPRNARGDQLLPAGDWTYWLILAGRGWGKTRTGAETVREWARTNRYVNIIGATADDARDIMVEGESGILAVCPNWERPIYQKSARKILWPNGATTLIFTADEPERLRGKQHEKLWADELAAWRYVESWDQAMFGLRLGRNPQAIITTTPRPTKELRALAANPHTVMSKGTTYDNRTNLAPSFFSQIIRRYEGTRLGRQELNAEILDDNPNALWKRADIDKARIEPAACPPLQRIVIGLDPSVSDAESHDLAGIIAVGRGAGQWRDHGFVVRDRSLLASPLGWARQTIATYGELKADRVIGEINNGGAMIEVTLRTVDPNVSYKTVTASRGKLTRAEPFAAMYEQGRVHHVGLFPELEDELCDYDNLDDKPSPNRMDALVWALHELFGEQQLGQGLFDYLQEQYEELKAKESA